MKRNYVVFSIFLSLTVLIAAGCSKKESSGSGSTDAGITTVFVGALGGAGSPPFVSYDAAGNPNGFEHQILAAIDNKLPQYKFEYQYQDMKGTLIGLDTGVLDIGANLFEWNQERAEKYLFSTVGYLDFSNYIVVPKDVNGIETLDDLQGKRVIVWPSSNTAYALEQYNAAHPGTPIEIVYSDNDDIQIKSLISGDVDASLAIPFSVSHWNAARKANVKISGPAVTESLAYFIFTKDNEELRKAVDGALQELVDSGELQSITDELFNAYFDSVASGQ